MKIVLHNYFTYSSYIAISEDILISQTEKLVFYNTLKNHTVLYSFFYQKSKNTRKCDKSIDEIV